MVSHETLPVIAEQQKGEEKQQLIFYNKVSHCATYNVYLGYHLLIFCIYKFLTVSFFMASHSDILGTNKALKLGLFITRDNTYAVVLS